MFAALALWFQTNAIGQWLAKAGAIAFGVFLVLWRVFAAGKQAQVAKQDAATLENLKSRGETDGKVEDMAPAARRNELSAWVRDGKQG